MKPAIIASVEFEMLDSSVSDKKVGYISGVRPNHYIDELGCTVIGEVDFENGSIKPGNTESAIITYVYWEPLEKVLKPGLTYEVREGSRIVGNVKVINVGETPNKTIM